MADVVNLGNIQIANAVSVVYTAGDNITISDDRVISAIVPTKTSDLDNDSGYITNNVDDLVNYTTTSQLNTLLSEKANVNDVYTKTESDSRYPLSTNVYSKTESDGKYSTIPETGNKIEVSINSSTYVMTMNLKDKNNNVLSTGTVDLPLESVVVGGRYDSDTKMVILTLQNGDTIEFSVADLISGLQETLIAGENIQINGNTISATDTTYTAGENITITGTTISAKDTTYTAGENVTITGTTISAKDTTYELSGETVDDVTTLTLEDSDGGTSTATVDCSKYQEELDTLNEIVDGLPHVEGEGTELSLSPTIKAPLKSTLKGNATQTTYSGVNQIGLQDMSSITASGLTFSISNGVLTVNGTASAKVDFQQVLYNMTQNTSKTLYLFLDSGTFTAGAIGVHLNEGNTQVSFVQVLYDATSLKTTKTLDLTNINQVWLYAISGSVFSNAKFRVMLSDSSSDSYEPYVGGVASPNPDYPQKVKVVTGHNTVTVTGKNIFGDGEQGGILPGDGSYSTNANNWRTKDYYVIDTAKTYTYSLTNKDTNYILRVVYYDKNKKFMQVDANSNTSYTFTPIANSAFIKLVMYLPGVVMTQAVIDEIKPQFEVGSTETTFEPHQEQSYALYLGGNVFDLSDVEENKSITASGGYVGNSSVCNLSGYTPVVSGLEYRLTYDYTSLLNTSNRSMCYYDKDKVFIRGNGYVPTSKNQTFTMPDNARYVRFSYDKNCTDISFSTDATPIELCKIEDYQDYLFKQNGKWYKHNAIGIKTFTGQENWTYTSVTRGSLFRYANMTDNLKVGSYAPYSYYYKGIKSSNSGSRTNYQFYLQSGNNFVDFIDNRFTDVDNFKNWLTTHNVKIYYVLATPTAVQITNQTIIDQLNAIEKAKSYKTQTNISSMYNTDNAQMIISASALYDLSALINA